MNTLHPFFDSYIPGDKAAFKSELQALADYLMTGVNELAAVMFNESLLNPQAVNGATNAAGLIQIMPATAAGLGYTTDEILNMNAVEQMRGPVKKYLATFRGKIGQFIKAYLSVFYPAAINKPSTWTFPQIVYQYNKGIDVNKDGALTVADFEAWSLKKFPVDLQNLLKKK